MTFLPVTKRYPAGPITPAGAWDLMRGKKPMLTYRSWDDAVVFNMLGPLAYWDNTQPESIRALELSGLIPPWQTIEQKGATQDGATYVTSLYDPIEVNLTVMAKGRDPAYTRTLVRDWIASWDAKKPGTLSWCTPEAGYWWAPVRWGKQPQDPYMGGLFTRQKLKMEARASDGFWRSYDTTDVFAFTYASAVDTFNYNTNPGLGAGWTIAYNTAGTGYLYADGTQCIGELSGGRSAVAQRASFTTGSDEQIVTLTIGPIDPWPADPQAYLDLWARMSNTGTPGQTGVRLRIGYHETFTKAGAPKYTPFLQLSYFVGGVQTVLRETEVTVPWQPTDQISLAVGGYSGQLYSYYVQRGTNSKPGTNNVTWQNLMTVVHSSADGSQVGPAYRGAGFGMESDGSQIPPSIKNWTAGDTTAAEEAGYVTLYNAGDQDMWPYFILVGPGVFAIGDGPSATQAVTYGPLLDNQIVLIRTDPRRYSVTNLTSMPPPGTPATNQFLSSLESAVQQYNSFLSNSSAPAPVLSPFGTPFPQGNPYSLLTGRFSRPIPAKTPGGVVPAAQIAVAVESGSPTTAILAGGTPLRRWPT